MKALPASNPISWVAQANIHNNKCPHGCWFFLPWHRAYLVYFERICRKVTGDGSFALPYWNWTTSPSIPAPFWGNSSNALYDGTRLVTSSDTADPSWVGASAIETILSNPSFELFASYKPPGGLPTHTGGGYGNLEATPHNNIHSWIGGDMGAFLSPLDPIFWMHHNMLDCLWVDWNINLGNANTSDSSWSGYNIPDFVDENGNPVTVPVIDTVLYPLFTYQFEPCSPNEKIDQVVLTGARLQQFLRAGAPSTLTFGEQHEAARAVSAPSGKAVNVAIPVGSAGFQNALGSDNKTRLVLTLEGVDIPAPAQFFVRVFVDKSDASGETPITDPHYAGSFGVFSDPKAMAAMSGDHRGRYLVDLTETVRKLNQAGSLTSDRLDVTLVSVPYAHREKNDQALAIQRVSVATARF
jgi:tyrosinase